MKLDYLENVNDYGDSILRLHQFNAEEASHLNAAIQSLLPDKELDFSTLHFIESKNCNLILRIGSEDLGILTNDMKNFICVLTSLSYNKMTEIIKPFCNSANGYQWLYDLNSPIEFLFSKNGMW